MNVLDLLTTRYLLHLIDVMINTRVTPLFRGYSAVRYSFNLFLVFSSVYFITFLHAFIKV